MKKYLTKVQVEKRFKSEVYPHIDKNDKPALHYAWVVFIDGLCKDGEISDNQFSNWNLPSFIK